MEVRRTDVKLASGMLPYAVFGEGCPLLYLHAAGGPQISRFLERLARTHRVYMPTAPGFEGTPFHDAVKTVADLAQLYGEFADKVIGQPCDVMGHSFGGWTALWFTLQNPDKVGKLVLEAPGGLRIGMKPLPPTASPEEALRRLYLHPENARHLIKPPEVAAANMQAFGRYNGGVMVDEALLARLSDVKPRTLIVMAPKDEMIPETTGHVLKERIPLSQLTCVLDAAHGIENDQPDRMLQLVSSFLDGDAFVEDTGKVA